MKLTANILIGLTAFICFIALCISVVPGVLNGLLIIGILLSICFVPVGGLIALITYFVLSRKGMIRGLKIPWAKVAIIFAILFFTYATLKLYIPRRIAFEFSRASFDQLVQGAPTSRYGGTPLNRRVGIYKVDEYAADPRGGVYFRVYWGLSGPDAVSYGFVYKPNDSGTPFGAAHYALFGLGNDWYWFRASNDWH